MEIHTGKMKIEADTADNLFKHMIGLSLSKKRSMLFLMPFNDRWSFWMFGVRYPLRMIFIDKNKRVVDFKDAVPLSLNPRTWRTYTPKKTCRYVLEVPFKLKIKIGDRISW
jgi:uncharacterized membrane protein (UPF0127 family)